MLPPSCNSVEEDTKALLNELEDSRVERPAWVAERYIGTRLRSFGTRKPAIHAIASKYVTANKDSGLRRIHEVADELWHAGIFEARSLAASILMRFRRRLDRRTFDLLSGWYDDVDNWANCDDVSVFVLGEFMFRDEGITSDVSGWVQSTNPWRRRAAVTATIPANREGRSDPRLVLDMVRSLLDDDDYYVKKSLGWVLRELGKSKPEAVAAFLRLNKDKLQKDQLRKAVKYIPKDVSMRFMD